jgi:hypothetical protein
MKTPDQTQSDRDGAADRLAPIVNDIPRHRPRSDADRCRYGSPVREIEGPTALVILGGPATSIVLNLLVLPALALRYGRFEPQE